MSEQEKINDYFSVEIMATTRLHLQYVTFQMALEHYNPVEFKDGNIRKVIDLAIKTYFVKQLINSQSTLYEAGIFSPKQARLLKDSYTYCLKEMRPHMVPLAETFAPNAVFKSTIGNEFGDIYEKQFEVAKNSRLNRDAVLPYHKETFLPLIQNRDTRKQQAPKPRL